MLNNLWDTIFYQPLYNALIFAISIMPGGDVGLAIILLTIVVKLILFPLAQRSIDSQIAMKALEPDIAKIKETVTDKTEQNKQVFALYKERKVNPFSGCLLILLQLPVIIALYLVFLHGFEEAPTALYSFISAPESFNLKFLGFLDLGQKSIVLALLAGISQFVQGKLAQGRQGKPSGEGMSGQFAKTMQTQMIYILPIMITVIAYRISAAVALYWIASNIFTIAQEFYTIRKIRKQAVK
ncbi:MAG: membrane protein insertase YidC [Candidatus Pacebacteria bacterium]|nr:membrane protein insertase YidC [Candidatus Paceibacterota bacterium]